MPNTKKGGFGQLLKKLVHKRILIMIVFAAILLILWLLYLILGSGEDKIMLLVLTPILPAMIYGIVRLMFKVVRINASVKFINFGVWFFLVTGTLGILMMAFLFISEFPNGLSPTLGACMGLVAAILAEAKKNIEATEKQREGIC